MYADDTSITSSSIDSNSTLKNINNEMDNVAEWMRPDKVHSNTDKSEFHFKYHFISNSYGDKQLMVIGHSRQQNNLDEI